MPTEKSFLNNNNDVNDMEERRPTPRYDDEEAAVIIATTIDTTAATTTTTPTAVQNQRYYKSIPNVLAVIEIDYERAAILFKRCMWFHLTFMALSVVMAAISSIDRDSPAFLVFYVVLALFFARLAYLHRIGFQLYAKKRIHMAITRDGIRQDVGQLDASVSAVTVFHRFANMKSVTVMDPIPRHKQLFCLAPAGLNKMTIPLRSRRWPPFVAFGIQNAEALEQLIRHRIQMATPVEAVAVASPMDHQQEATK